MKINRYLPIAYLYFFVNSFALPFGLTYTAVLSPVFYRWVVVSRRKEILLPFFACLTPFMVLHLLNGVQSKVYLVSIINFTTVYIFCQAFYTFLIRCRDKEKIFTNILIANFIFCLIAIPVYFSSFDSMLWMKNGLTEGIREFRRMKLFTYEASYYATLFTPVMFYFLLQVCFRQNRINSWLIIVMLLLPYALSFSLGVVGCIMISLIITFFIYWQRLLRKSRVRTLVTFFIFGVLALLLVLWIFPDNTLMIRIENILTGHDTSGKGRTTDAFMLAGQILEKKSDIWGVGAGQIKVLGADIIRSYYLYDLDYNKIAIPNAAAETLAIFGWVGLSIRILTEILLFFYTRVWNNYFRLLLFLFIFMYQFTGSFITNIAEYVIWIIAFTNVFPQFNVLGVRSSGLGVGDSRNDGQNKTGNL